MADQILAFPEGPKNMKLFNVAVIESSRYGLASLGSSLGRGMDSSQHIHRL
jgi:hypothetical protein